MQFLKTFTSPHQPEPSRESTRLLAILATLFFTLTVAGCSKQTQTGNVADTTAAATPPPPASVTPAPLTDGNILAILRETDSAEIMLGKLAASKTKNAAVKGFADMMIHDHSRLLKGDDDLAMKLKLTPAPPANDSIPEHVTAMISSLNAASPESFNTMYIDGAVMGHTNALAAVKGFETTATAPELKDALKSAEPIIAHHLARAKAIQAELNKPKPIAMEKKNR